MPRRKYRWPLAFLILLGFVLSARADDANIQMTTTNGSTQFGFQNSSGQDVVTVNSAGVLLVSSNTILSGTTFYQNGNVNLGSSGDVITMPIVNISSNAVMPGATFYQGANIVMGTTGQGVVISTRVSTSFTVGNSAIPTVANGTNATCTIGANSTNTYGTLSVVMAAGGTASAALCTVTLGSSGGAAHTVVCAISTQNAAAGRIALAQVPFVTGTTSTWILTNNTTGLAAGTYAWNYVCGGF